MPSHLACIGLPVTSSKALELIAERAIKQAEIFGTSAGRYFRWRSASGAELWLQADRKRRLMGVNPHFAGAGRLRVVLHRWFRREEDSELDAALQGWVEPGARGDPNPGLYPLAFDVPDAARHLALALPRVETVQITAFCHELSVWPDEVSFREARRSSMEPAGQWIDAGKSDAGAANTGAANTGAADTGVASAGAANTGAANTGAADTGAADTGVASAGAANTGAVDTGAADAGAARAGAGDARDGSSKEPVIRGVAGLIPSGLFTPRGDPVEVPASQAIITGVVRQAERLELELVERDGEGAFYWLLVQGWGGSFDLVASPEVLHRTPRPGAVVRSACWLSGRLVSRDKERRTWWDRLRNR